WGQFFNAARLKRLSHRLGESDGEIGEHRCCSHESNQPFQNPKAGVAEHCQPDQWPTTATRSILSHPAASAMRPANQEIKRTQPERTICGGQVCSPTPPEWLAACSRVTPPVSSFYRTQPVCAFAPHNDS